MVRVWRVAAGDDADVVDSALRCPILHGEDREICQRQQRKSTEADAFSWRGIDVHAYFDESRVIEFLTVAEYETCDHNGDLEC